MMKPCGECGSTRSQRFEVNAVFGYEESSTQCYDTVGCRRRWKAKEVRELKEACSRGQHPMYGGDRCVYCGASYVEVEDQDD